MPVRTRYHSKRNAGKSRSQSEWTEHLPHPERMADMPNPGMGHVRDPETRRVEKVAKPAPRPRRHQKV